MRCRNTGWFPQRGGIEIKISPRRMMGSGGEIADREEMRGVGCERNIMQSREQ